MSEKDKIPQDSKIEAVVSKPTTEKTPPSPSEPVVSSSQEEPEIPAVLPEPEIKPTKKESEPDILTIRQDRDSLEDTPVEEPTPVKKPEVDDIPEPTRVYHSVHENPEEEKKKNAAWKKEKKKSRRRTIWAVVLLLIVCVGLVIGVVGGLMVKRMVDDSPELNLTDFVGEESTKIYDNKGEVITEIGTYLRENITYDKCPETLVDAFLSIEDSRYFQHFGFDIPRFTKALIENVKNGNFSQGGSTFTMQLVKLTYFSVDAGDNSTERVKDIEYKVQQIYLAIKLDSQLDKKEIFQLYMNKLNFGGNIRGVQKASLYYFGKNCWELNLSESAMLAGIVNLPNRYNPYDYLDYATSRRNEVIDLMVYHGYITQEEADLAKAIKVEDQLVGESRDIAEDSQYQSYIDTVVSEAQKLTGKDPTVYGMEIYTSMSREVQETIDSIQDGTTEGIFPDDEMQVAMISMNNHTGEIIAIGGGRNYDGARLLNRATAGFKQPGSSIKPVLSYALAFEYLGYTMDEIILDAPITYPNESRVLVNAGGNYTGDITIQDAVAYSLNIPAILTLEKVVDKIGKEKVVSYMQSIGYTVPTNDNFHLSFAIGGTWFETTVYEMAGAHSMLINGGVYNEPHTITKLVMSDGTEFYPQNQNRRVLSPGSAYLACMLMQNNVEGPYFNYMQLLRRGYPVYAKTGTSDWASDGLQYGIPQGAAKDKWMISSTNVYTNAVWVGYDMAVAGKQNWFTDYKQSLNIQGQLNKILLDSEDTILESDPTPITKPDDVEDITYVYGTYPHVQPEDWMDPSVYITSQVSKTGLESAPLVSSTEYLTEEAPVMKGISASIDQYGTLNVSWDTNSGICSGGVRNISLHDDYNNIDQTGTCLADLSWLVAGSGNAFYATVYNDDVYVADIGSDTGYYSGWPGDMWGTVKVCGGYSNNYGTSETVCTTAGYQEIPEDQWVDPWAENW